MSPLSSESIAFQSSFCQALPKTARIAFSFLSENGDSVIVPIRIDVDGAIEPYNSVNSVFDAYNPAYVADLLRDENIRYTRNNKSVEELLSNRRQVPAATRSNDAYINAADVNVAQKSSRVKAYISLLRRPTVHETAASNVLYTMKTSTIFWHQDEKCPSGRLRMLSNNSISKKP